MFNKILAATCIIVVSILIYVVYVFQKEAGDVAEQVVNEQIWLDKLMSDRQAQNIAEFSDSDHQQLKKVAWQLVRQQVDADRRFIRVYHGLFIKYATKHCLEVSLTYLKKEPQFHQARWLAPSDECLP